MISRIKEFYIKHKSISDYVFFAIITSVLHVLVFYLSNLIFNSLIVCNIIAYTFSILFSFFINKNIVFKDNAGNVGFELFKYLIVKFSSFIIDTVVLLLLTHWIILPTLLAKLIANISTTFNNYWLSKIFVFKRK